MKILDKRDDSWIYLKDLPVGEAFELSYEGGGEIYLKTDIKNYEEDIISCVELSSGIIDYFDDFKQVKPVNTQLTIMAKQPTE